MDKLLTDYRALIIGIFVAIGLLIFRKELNKLIDWIVGFKRLSKTRDGYAASSLPEASGVGKPETPSEIERSRVKETKEVDSNGQKEKNSWVRPFLDKRYDEAAEVLRGLIAAEADADKKLGHQAVLGHVLFEQDKQKGTAYFEELRKTTRTSAQVYHWHALSLFWHNDYGCAASILRDGIDVCPSTNSELLDLLGLVLHRDGKDVEAASILMQGIEKYPREPRTYRTLAQLLADVGLKDQAVSCCVVGMTSCPDDADLIEKYVSILSGDEHSKERMVGYLKLADLRKDNAKYSTLLGNEYLALGLSDLALEAYRKGNTQAQEKEAWILANIGNLLKNQGFYSYGAEYLQRAVAIEPESQYAHDRLGQSLKMASDQAQKRTDLRAEVMKELRKPRSFDGLVADVRNAVSQQTHAEATSETAPSAASEASDA